MTGQAPYRADDLSHVDWSDSILLIEILDFGPERAELKNLSPSLAILELIATASSLLDSLRCH